METPVQLLLKVLIYSLLLVLVLAVGMEVAAVHRLDPTDAATASTHTPPVVVRKAAHVPAPAKLVRPLPGRKRNGRRHLGS
jgi:hypothetical protein